MGAETVSHAVDEGSSLLEYVDVVRRRRWAVLQALVLVPLVAVLVSLRQSPLYRATAADLFNGQTYAASFAGAADPNAGQDPARLLQTQADLAASPAVARIAAVLAHRHASAAELLKVCSVGPKSDANLLLFACTDGNADRAVGLATAYARAFTTYRRRLDTAALEQARRSYAVTIAKLTRQHQTGTALYAQLVGREKELATQEALQTSNASLAQSAQSATKTRPRPIRNGIFGLALGGVLGIALAFLLEALDTRVRSTRELERRLGLPLLARIPTPPRWAQRTNRLVMIAEPNGFEAESFRVLRTNLDFFNIEHGARTIMVTSAVEQEGKSTTVANLAVALSRAGQRVVLVDLDLRRPTLDRFFHFEGRPGITDVAFGRARLASAHVDEDTPQRGSLDVLTTGSLPEDTGEFVGSRALTGVLEHLRERADVVLIDSPPLLAVGDAIALTAKVDAVIVLTRLGVARRRTVDELRRVLGNCAAAKIGFVVTGAELEPHRKYGYGYGYGYGYMPKAQVQR